MNAGSVTVSLVPGYDTESLLTQLQTQIAVRGQMKFIYSDSGSQLKAAKEMLEAGLNPVGPRSSRGQPPVASSGRLPLLRANGVTGGLRGWWLLSRLLSSISISMVMFLTTLRCNISTTNAATPTMMSASHWPTGVSCLLAN